MKIRPRLRKKSRNPAWCEQKIARHVIMQIKVDLICVSLGLTMSSINKHCQNFGNSNHARSLPYVDPLACIEICHKLLECNHETSTVRVHSTTARTHSCRSLGPRERTRRCCRHVLRCPSWVMHTVSGMSRHAREQYESPRIAEKASFGRVHCWRLGCHRY